MSKALHIPPSVLSRDAICLSIRRRVLGRHCPVIREQHKGRRKKGQLRAPRQ